MALEIQNKFEKSKLWDLKVRLQFSGWLQYIIHAIWAIILYLIAAIGWLIGYWQILLFWIPLILAIFFTIALVGTILIVKYNLHPQEKIPSNNKDLDAFSLMRKRHSCRSFQSRKLTQEHFSVLMHTVQLYTQSDNLLGKLQVRFEYVAANLKVWPVVGAHEFLVAIAPKRYNRLAIIDIGRSLQKVVHHATRMGLATCWIGPGADQKSIIEHLGNRFNHNKDHVICVCAIGYESMFKPLFIRFFQKLQHKRLPLKELFFTDCKLSNSIDVKELPFSDYNACYEVCQWAPSSYNGQTTRSRAVFEDGQLIRFDFYTATNSRYYAPLALGIWCANWEIGCTALGKEGYFSIMEDASNAKDELPHYDISWVIDNNDENSLT
ncbi:nitroreductase family protein [Fangia hongkongensis]|uniref:nitroreductase family protein n=1 Tax=Fangia hongkongensis TaxID=270495 RepID=UPI00035CDD77|nr:nitroreductase family protein [Fangia hongkongensis]MBK2125679.1 nitroreductase family protein [Fangia hongkongensis]